MIPNTIYELAVALGDEFDLTFDDAVSAAWRIRTALESNNVFIKDGEPQ